MNLKTSSRVYLCAFLVFVSLSASHTVAGDRPGRASGWQSTLGESRHAGQTRTVFIEALFPLLYRGIQYFPQTHSDDLAPAADQYFAGDASALSAAKWGAGASGPFTSLFVTGNTANFATPNGTGAGASITIGGITALENFTLTSVGGTIANASNGIVPILVSAGKTLDFGTQSFTTSATAGYTFTGPGTLALAGNTFGGGFTINSGTVILRGINGMGGGATNHLTINGGTIAANTSRDLTGKYPNGITIGGNFQLGALPAASPLSAALANLTFSNSVSLGSENRTITIGADGVYSFVGAIGGSPGAGLRFERLPSATGLISLQAANTYTGETVIAGSTVSLGGSGSIASSPVIEIAPGGILSVNSAASPITLAAGQDLRGSGTTGFGEINTSSTRGLNTASDSSLIFSAFNGSTAPLRVRGSGTLVLQSSNPVEVVVANSGTPLGAGTYKLIAKTGTASVVGTPSTVTVSGDGLAAGGSATLVNNAGELFMNVTVAVNPGVFSFDPSSYSPEEDDGMVTVTVKRTGGTTGAVAVNYGLSGGGLTGRRSPEGVLQAATGGAACVSGSGVDFVTPSGTLNFADGEDTKSFQVQICEDALFEGTETISVVLSNPTGGATTGTPSTAAVNILDNDAQPSLQFSATNFDVNENAGTANITVTRTGASDHQLTVNYSAVTGGTATSGTCGAFSGNDFEPASGTLTFAPGDNSETFAITICNDALFESASETILIALNTPSSPALLGTPNDGTVTIIPNNDPPTVQFSVSTATVLESATTYTATVTRTGATENSFSVDFAAAGDTATFGAGCDGGTDAIENSGSLSFTGGDPSKQISITICNDADVDPDETFVITLSDATGGAVIGAGNPQTVTITDNEFPAMVIVNSSDDVDDGACSPNHCSLREAILAANSNPDTTTIAFASGGGMSIAPLTPLPAVTTTTVIDGFANTGTLNALSGALPVPTVELNGDNLEFPAAGIDIQVSNCVVRGLIINRFPLANVLISGGTGSAIEGNYIGLNAAGDERLGSTSAGVFVVADSNTIGGPLAAQRNVIAGAGINVRIVGSSNVVAGNYIGTSATGVGLSLGGGSLGVTILGDGNVVGGDTAEQRNLISGLGSTGVLIAGSSFAPSENNEVKNNYIGVSLDGGSRLANLGNGVELSGSVVGTMIEANVIAGNGTDFGSQLFAQIALRRDTNNDSPSNNAILGNRIGTNASGDAAVSAAQIHAGIEITNSANNTIGGSTVGERNIIGGNRRGLFIQGGNATGNVVKGNYIGAGGDGTGAVPNGDLGAIFISSTASGNTIGGVGAGEGNLIANNQGPGIRVDQFGGGNLFRGNSIFNNLGLGIDLDVSGVTANDAGDPDVNAGGDPIQNFPVISSATAGSVMTVSGSLNSTAGGTFTLDFYMGPVCDDTPPVGTTEGKTYLGSLSVTADGSGEAAFDFGSTGLAAGQYVTATATGASTSELSMCVEISSPTAADASIAGAVRDARGRGIRDAWVHIQGTSGGRAASVRTNAYGRWRAEGLAAGESYVVSVEARRYAFAPASRLVNLTDNIDGLDFTASP